MKPPLDEYLTRLGPEKKQYYVDEAAIQTFSLIAGTGLDFGYSGLGVSGWGVSRLEGAIGNRITGGTYGKWRDNCYDWTNTKESSGKIRKFLAETLAFETFQVPLYGAVVTVASLLVDQIGPGIIKDGLDFITDANYKEIFLNATNTGWEGMKGAAKWSPLMIWASKDILKKFRTWYNIKNPEEKVAEKTS